jgi:hypothetical protein
VTFPGGVTTIAITGESLLDLDGTPLNGFIILTPSRPVYVAGTTVLEGSASMQVSGGVATPITVPTTDAVSPSFTYTITQRLATPDGVPPAPVTGVTIPASTGASVDISILLEQFG